MLKSKRGTAQIDHIVISVYGIFVIETKNYKGWITGTEQAEQWTKNMYGKKYRFRNPILQNYGHVVILEQVLELPKSDFIPIVVFSTDAELKVKCEHQVIYTVNLKKTIQQYQDKKFTTEQVKQYTQRIQNANIDSRENRKKHVENIHVNQQMQQNKVRDAICPRCGGKLIEREGKYGRFMGCSNYPKCRYTTKQ